MAAQRPYLYISGPNQPNRPTSAPAEAAEVLSTFNNFQLRHAPSPCRGTEAPRGTSTPPRLNTSVITHSFYLLPRRILKSCGYSPH
jgi:hypothetical protein